MDKVPSKQQGAPPPEAAKAETRLKGHIGHLTKQEETALIAFKDLCAKEKYFQPATVSSKASHDDATLVRFLRARKFVPQDAFLQFKDTEVWRRENKLEALYDQIDSKDYQESRSVYPQWTGRRDKRGMPVYLYEVGKLDAKKMLAYTSSTSKTKHKGPSPSRMLRLFALYENLTRFVMPLCTAAPGRPNQESPVDQSNNIVDISGVGLKQFWNLKNHMQDASQLATAHYPETLDRIFIVGAPTFFPTVWGWIKRWFDPITTSKIFVLSSQQVLPTLKQFMDIEDIPQKYGGQLKFECGDLPNLDPELREYLDLAPGPDTERNFLTLPVRWLDAGDDGAMQAVGVGTIDGKQRQERIATLQGVAKRVATHRDRLSRANTRTSTSPSLTPSGVSSTGPRPLSQRQISHTTHASPLATSDTPNAAQQSTELRHAQSRHTPTSPLATSDATVTSPPGPISETVQAITKPTSPTTTSEALDTNHATETPGVHPDAKVSDKAAEIMASLTINGTAQNGGPPEKISMPPPSTDLERQKTVYMTPPSESNELKQIA